MPDLKITLNGGQLNRAREAFGQAKGLTDGNGNPRPADQTELEELFMAFLERVVLQEERRAKVRALPSTPFRT